ncbi:hypothetical protein Tco_0460643, partial [Tanacetum coccineum]
NNMPPRRSSATARTAATAAAPMTATVVEQLISERVSLYIVMRRIKDWVRY